MHRTIVTVLGARPQFVKAAMVSRAVGLYNESSTSSRIEEILVHTGQHYDYDMSEVFFSELGIPQPRHHLGVGSGTHGEMTARILESTERVLNRERPDGVLVYGDTNTTLAAALAAAKLGIPVAHVESGLRSFNRAMPEEINRVLTDHLSSTLFCPTETSVANLEREGIMEGVFRVGDVMYDAFLWFRDLAESRSDALSRFGVEQGSYCLATVHRQENTEDPQRLAGIFEAFEQLASRECVFLVPLHPRTRKALERDRRTGSCNPWLRLLPPLGYLDLVALESGARAVLTDSGGVQKEAFFAKAPCITLRDETEWVETVEAGWNVLAGADRDRIELGFRNAMEFSPDGTPELYGNGDASRRIVESLMTV